MKWLMRCAQEYIHETGPLVTNIIYFMVNLLSEP